MGPWRPDQQTDTLEKDLSNVYQKSDTIRVRKSSVKSPSTLYYFSIREIYNRVDRDKKTVSIWSHIFQGLIHQCFQRDITIIYSVKNGQWITWLDGKIPSYNTTPQCIRLVIHQNQWYYFVIFHGTERLLRAEKFPCMINSTVHAHSCASENTL